MPKFDEMDARQRKDSAEIRGDIREVRKLERRAAAPEPARR
jgi:hypothetical protein